MRAILLTILAGLLAAPAYAFEPNVNDEMELDVAKAILAIKRADPGIEAFFENAAGYAVFPSVGKGGLVDDRVDGYTSMTQGTIGLQIGGQKYAQFIFFKDATAIDHFRRGNFEFGAQASAVAITKGASADASYDGGVAVFTHAAGGLMLEGSVGGQRFTYQPKQ